MAKLKQAGTAVLTEIPPTPEPSVPPADETPPNGASPSPALTTPTRTPRKGDMVFYMEAAPDGRLEEVPAMLVKPSGSSGRWHLNAFKFGVMVRRTDIAFSEKPTLGCWTWRD